MKRSCPRFLLSLLTALLPLAAYAQAPSGFTLAPPASDLSFQYLSNIFGVVSGVLHGSGTQIFGQMFNVFNSAILALGGIVVTYTFMVSTLNTAGQGEIMGREWSSIWIPIRSAGGIALLLPKGTGYSAIQVFMMWVVVQGIGAADRLWGTTLDYLKQGGVIIQQNASGFNSTETTNYGQPSAMNNIAKLFINSICLQSYQANMQQLYQRNPAAYSAPPPSVYALISTQIAHEQSLITSSISGGSALIGLPWPSSPSASLTQVVGNDVISDYGITSKCGSVSVTFPSRPSGVPSVAPLAQARLLAIQQMITDLQIAASAVQSQYVQTSETAGATFPKLGFSNCNAIAPSPCINGTCTASDGSVGICAGPVYTNFGTGFLSSTLFQDTMADYLGIVYAASQNSMPQPSASRLSGSIVNQAKKDGWLMAGRYYIDLANANNNANQFGVVWNSFPISVTMPSFSQAALSWTGVLNDNTMPSAQLNINTYVNAAMNYVTTEGNIGTQSQTRNKVAGVAAGLVATAAAGVFAPFLIPIITGIIDIFVGMADLLSSQQSNMNPIAAIAIIGGGMMNVSVGFFITGALISFALSLGLGAMPCMDLSGAGVALVAWIAPIMSGIVAIMFTSGAIMAYYIPLIPFILFTFGGIGWFISVIEAMIAAPLVALGIAHPEGHQAFGKGEPAIMLTANVFLKPSLMVFGYIAGISMSYVGVWILNHGFMSTFYSTVTSMLTSGSVVGSMFAIIGIPLASIIFYTIVAMIIVQKAFSLIHVIPERVLKWIGGAAEGHGEQEMLQQARGGMEKAAQAEGGMMQKGAEQGAGDLQKEASKQREAKKKESGGASTQDKTDTASIQGPTAGGGPGAGAGGGGGGGGGAAPPAAP